MTRTYMGIEIEPKSAYGYYSALIEGYPGYLKADTLAGIKDLIRAALNRA